MKKITASIVVYKNSLFELEKTIKSFLNSTLTGELVIVDNSPTQVAKEISGHFNCQYIYPGSNLGYGKAHNLVMKQSVTDSTYHLVLNPDVYFEPDVLEKLYYFMEDHPEAGLTMPKVLYPNGSVQHLCKLLPHPFNLASRRFLPHGIPWLDKLNNHYEMNFSGYSTIMNVPFLSGCFMFMRSSALQKVGLFDEQFFLYAEDTDLSRRIHQEFSTLFFPSAEIYHTHARGSYKNFKLTWCNIKSAVQYFNKWGWFFDPERSRINQIASQSFYLPTYESANLKGTILAQRSMNE